MGKRIPKRKKELSRSMFDVLLGVSACFILVFMAVYGFYTWKEDVRKSEQYYQETLKNFIIQIDNTIKEMNIVACQVIANPELQEMLIEADQQEFREKNYFEYHSEERIKAQGILWTFNMPCKIVDGINVFTENSYVGLSLSPSQQVIKEVASQSKWQVDKKEYKVLPTHTDDWRKTDRQFFSVVRRVVNTSVPFQELGFVEVQESVHMLEEICTLESKNDYSIMILERQGQEIFSKGKTDIPRNIDFSCTQDEIEVLEWEDPSDKDKKLACFGAAKNAEWIVLIVQSKKDIMQPAYMNMAIIIFGGILLLVVLVIVFYIVSREIAEPINQLTKELAVVSFEDPLQMSSKPEKYYEVEMLRKTFVEMTQKLKSSAEMLAMARESEFYLKIDQLQAKANPHFLYNAFTAIGAVGEEAGSEKVGQMCFELSNLYQYISMDNGQMATLQEEINHVGFYLQFMKFRYEEGLQYTIQFDEALCEVPVIRLVFQPIIENCFNHGFKSIVPPFRLEAVCTKTEGGWLFRVDDNGIGFDMESQKQIQEKIIQVDEICNNGRGYKELHADNMALVSVYARLKYQYGDNLHFEIGNGSCLGGARVMIKVDDEKVMQ